MIKDKKVNYWHFFLYLKWSQDNAKKVLSEEIQWSGILSTTEDNEEANASAYHVGTSGKWDKMVIQKPAKS